MVAPTSKFFFLLSTSRWIAAPSLVLPNSDTCSARSLSFAPRPLAKTKTDSKASKIAEQTFITFPPIEPEIAPAPRCQSHPMRVQYRSVCKSYAFELLQLTRMGKRDPQPSHRKYRIAIPATVTIDCPRSFHSRGAKC